MKRLFFLSMLLGISACSKEGKEMKVQLANFQKIEITGDYLSIYLLESYPNKKECTQEKLTANLYRCVYVADSNKVDTLLVFEPCKVMPDNAKADETKGKQYIIEKRNLIKGSFTSLMINIPDSSLIKKESKYILATLTKVEY